MAVIELAALRPFTSTHLAFLDQLTQSHRRRAQHHRGDDADGEPAQQSQQLTIELQTRQIELQQTNEELGVQGQAARRAERGGRAQEQGGRAGPPRARGEGRRAGAHLASTSPSSSRTCRTSCARRSTRSSSSASSSAENVGGNLTGKQIEFARNIHSAGTDLLDADQRHPRPVEDRVGHGHRRARGDHVRRPARQRPPHFRHVAETKDLRSTSRSIRRLPRAFDQRPEAPAADPQEPAVQRVQVHRAGLRVDVACAW